MKRPRTWVLDTETKGTGATVVPLEKLERKEGPKHERLWVPPKKTPREPDPPEPPAPRRFRVLDVISREVLLQAGSARQMLSLLGTVEHMHDVNLYVWEPGDERWRLLSVAEQRVVWERRGKR